MGPVNNLLNHIYTWNGQKTDPFKRVIGSRITNLFITAPIELIAVAQNILLTPIHTVEVVLKMSLKIIVHISGSIPVKNFENKLRGVNNLLYTISKIVSFAVGTILTVTLGVISPKANFKAHCALNLVINKKEEAKKLALIEKNYEAIKKLQDHLSTRFETENTYTNSDVNHPIELKELPTSQTVYEIPNTIKNDTDVIITDTTDVNERLEEQKTNFNTTIEERNIFCDEAIEKAEKRVNASDLNESSFVEINRDDLISTDKIYFKIEEETNETESLIDKIFINTVICGKMLLRPLTG